MSDDVRRRPGAGRRPRLVARQDRRPGGHGAGVIAEARRGFGDGGHARTRRRRRCEPQGATGTSRAAEGSSSPPTGYAGLVPNRASLSPAHQGAAPSGKGHRPSTPRATRPQRPLRPCLRCAQSVRVRANGSCSTTARPMRGSCGHATTAAPARRARCRLSSALSLSAAFLHLELSVATRVQRAAVAAKAAGRVALVVACWCNAARHPAAARCSALPAVGR